MNEFYNDEFHGCLMNNTSATTSKYRVVIFSVQLHASAAKYQ